MAQTQRVIWIMEFNQGHGWEPTLPGFHHKKEAVDEARFWTSTKGKPMKFRAVKYAAIREKSRG